MNNVSVRLVFDRKHVATKKHQASVQVEVTYQRKRKYFGTGIKLYADQWGKDLKVKNHPQSLVFNQKLNDMISGIHDYVYQLSTQKIPFTFERLDQHLGNYGADTTKSFLHFMRKRINERQIAESTRIKHKCVLKALEEFGKIKNFSDICYENIKAYDEFAKKRCKHQSSVYNYHKILKIFVREAHAAQLISVDPYQNFKLERGKSTVRRFLTKEELAKIEVRRIDDISLNRVRDVFLFCCYTGLAYADLKEFDFKDAIMTNGMYRIRYNRVKTGTPYNISLMDKAMDILRKYDFKLPIISNQKYNAYLKVLGAFCGVKKRLTSHVARHTFATTITLANGVRIEVVSKMLGHTNIRTTQLYAHIYQAEVDKEFERLNNIV
ncbi:site-specific integrase [Bacteroides acidifaciens]|uniref:site-specific integrase n=1 Tax=Bacteroides acidifaciens TaxID=85831 RepID=UPI0026EAD7E2|nr:site-specific integrase [Bacteroides acidifaciens]